MMAHTWDGKGFHIWHNGIMAKDDEIDIVDSSSGGMVHKVPVLELIRFLEEEYYPYHGRENR